MPNRSSAALSGYRGLRATIQRNHRTAGLRRGGDSGAGSISVWNSSCIRVLFALKFAKGGNHRFPFKSHTELVAGKIAETNVSFHKRLLLWQINSIAGANRGFSAPTP